MLFSNVHEVMTKNVMPHLWYWAPYILFCIRTYCFLLNCKSKRQKASRILHKTVNSFLNGKKFVFLFKHKSLHTNTCKHIFFISEFQAKNIKKVIASGKNCHHRKKNDDKRNRKK